MQAFASHSQVTWTELDIVVISMDCIRNRERESGGNSTNQLLNIRNKKQTSKHSTLVLSKLFMTHFENFPSTVFSLLFI